MSVCSLCKKVSHIKISQFFTFNTDRFFYIFNINQPTGFSSGNSSLILSRQFFSIIMTTYLFWGFIRSTGRNSKFLWRGAYHLRQQWWHHSLHSTKNFPHSPRVVFQILQILLFFFINIFVIYFSAIVWFACAYTLHGWLNWLIYAFKFFRH